MQDTSTKQSPWRSSNTEATTPKDWNYILEELNIFGEASCHSVPRALSPRPLRTNVKTRSRATIILPVALHECETWFSKL